MTARDLTPLCRDPSNGIGCWRADCRSACCSTAEEAAIRSRWQHDAVPPWRRVEPTMVCEVRFSNLDLLVVCFPAFECILAVRLSVTYVGSYPHRRYLRAAAGGYCGGPSDLRMRGSTDRGMAKA